MNEIDNIEKLILSNIDLQTGPDNIQTNLAIKLNIFKIFSLNVRKNKERRAISRSGFETWSKLNPDLNILSPNG
jgi:hypothetical protein